MHKNILILYDINMALPISIKPNALSYLQAQEEIKPKINEKKIDANKIKMGDVLSELKNRFNKSD